MTPEQDVFQDLFDICSTNEIRLTLQSSNRAWDATVSLLRNWQWINVGEAFDCASLVEAVRVAIDRYREWEAKQ